jgi:hypothetical protein
MLAVVKSVAKGSFFAPEDELDSHLVKSLPGKYTLPSIWGVRCVGLFFL